MILGLLLLLPLLSSAAAAPASTLPSPSSAAAQPARVAPYLVPLGDVERVFDVGRQRCGAGDTTDSMPIAWQPVPRGRGHADNRSAVFMVASAEHGVYPNVGASLSRLTHDCSTLVFNSSFDNDPALFAMNGWLQSVTVLDGGDVVGLVHQEYHGWQASPPTVRLREGECVCECEDE